ncbi:MAG: hypothetical protein RL404_825 [Pseudomonadota bacterium]|jgi:hypothetical protein
MTINTRLTDALFAARHASAAAPPPAAVRAGGMAPVSLTPLAPPGAAGATAPGKENDDLPGMVPTARRELFDRTREELLDMLGRRDFGALPPSWAAISGRLSQEEAASAAAALQLIAARVSP